MTLSEKQQLFTIMVANLIHWAEEHGYRLTFGEAYRTPEQAALNAKKGSGITNSLHTRRLAVDFNLFVNGQYQTRTEDYLPLGEYPFLQGRRQRRGDCEGRNGDTDRTY